MPKSKPDADTHTYGDKVHQPRNVPEAKRIAASTPIVTAFIGANREYVESVLQLSGTNDAKNKN